MNPAFAAALALSLSHSPDLPDSSALDSARVVRHFPAVEVSAGRLHDLRSNASVHVITPEALRTLPIGSLTQAIALQPGVVLIGEELHVRGGRAGETQWVTSGLTLEDPVRGRAPEVPVFAVQRAELLSGGLDAEYPGTLAGVIDLRTWSPTEKPTAALRWLSSGKRGGAYDWAGGRLAGPLPGLPFGYAIAAEARLDDQGMPGRHSRGRAGPAAARFGWRNDNHVLGLGKLATKRDPATLSVEWLESRVIRAPYDPMFTWNDSVLIHTITPLPDGQIGPPLIDSMNVFYRADDHLPMTEQRRHDVIAQSTRAYGETRVRIAAGWSRASTLTSAGLTHDWRAIQGDSLRFGDKMDPRRDPFHAYQGDVPYFHETRADRWQLAVTSTSRPFPNQRLGGGAGVTYEDITSLEYDDALRIAGLSTLADPVRRYHTHAPGGWAYLQHRGEREGLVWNVGLRLQAWTAGDARAPGPASDQPDIKGRGWFTTLSPRLGLVIPFGVRDALSASYARIHQAPARDFLADSRVLVYTHRPLGSPTLEPTELVTTQAGFKHLLNARWAFQVSYFQRDLYHQIGIVNDAIFANTFRARYANSEYGHANGFELALLANARGPDGDATRAHRSWPLRFLDGELSVRYTNLTAQGSISDPEGWPYGSLFGARPLPSGEHPLDWDRGHTFTFDGVWREPRVFTLAWVTQLGSGARWTPTVAYAGQTGGPLATPDLQHVNSQVLRFGERSDLALRVEPRALHGVRVLLDVRNVFDSRSATLASLAGWPNPTINTQRDDYGGYRTDTGLDGAAYWDPRLNAGRGGWVPVSDPRLRQPGRSVRLGFEVGL